MNQQEREKRRTELIENHKKKFEEYTDEERQRAIDKTRGSLSKIKKEDVSKLIAGGVICN